MKALKKEKGFKKTTVGELSLSEKMKAIQAEAIAAQQEEERQVTEEINAVLQKSGYGLSARMVIVPGQPTIVEPFIVKKSQ